MIGIAVVGVLAFVVFLLAGRIRMAGTAGSRALNIRWPQLMLAVLLVIVVALTILWQFPPLDGEAKTGAAATDWRSDSRAVTFFIVMLVAAGAGILVFLGSLYLRANPPAPVADDADAASPAAGAEAAVQHQTPAAGRLAGLLLLVLAVLLLCWISLPLKTQYALVLQLLYPVTIAVALVMLFDKATRSWSAKNGGESYREWLLCDLAVFFLILGFLNLLESNAGEKYEALIWDMLHIAAFFVVFWMLDRKMTRTRFLAAYAYLTALPILLLIWRAVQNVPDPKNPSWWSTIWPLFFLSVIFLVLELIAVVASRDREKQALPAIKDSLYLVLVAIVLISAVPGTSE